MEKYIVPLMFIIDNYDVGVDNYISTFFAYKSGSGDKNECKHGSEEKLKVKIRIAGSECERYPMLKREEEKRKE